MRKSSKATAKSRRETRPKTLVDFERDFPEIWKAFGWLRDACDHGGPLDEKVRELIKIGIETAQVRRGGLAAHIHRAEKAGASKGEISQAILLAAPLVGMAAILDAFRVAAAQLD